MMILYLLWMNHYTIITDLKAYVFHWNNVFEIYVPSAYIKCTLIPRSNPADSAWVFQRNNIVSSFSVWLGDHVNDGLVELKSVAQAKITKKSGILFWRINMTIWCKHVHRLELQKFFIFCAAHSPVRLDEETKFLHFLFFTWLSKIRNQMFTSYGHINKPK